MEQNPLSENNPKKNVEEIDSESQKSTTPDPGETKAIQPGSISKADTMEIRNPSGKTVQGVNSGIDTIDMSPEKFQQNFVSASSAEQTMDIPPEQLGIDSTAAQTLDIPSEQFTPSTEQPTLIDSMVPVPVAPMPKVPLPKAPLPKAPMPKAPKAPSKTLSSAEETLVIPSEQFTPSTEQPTLVDSMVPTLMVPSNPPSTPEETLDIPPEQFGQDTKAPQETINIPPEQFNQTNSTSTAQETMDIPAEQFNQTNSTSTAQETMDIPAEQFSQTNQNTNQATSSEETAILENETVEKTEVLSSGGSSQVETREHSTPQQKKGGGKTTMVQPGANRFLADPQIGEFIVDYKVEKKLGEGGMGTVYKAFDPNLKRYVAIKLLRSRFTNDPKFRARFEIEAQAVAQLRHSNIIQVFRAGEDKNRGCLFFAMDFIEGKGLDVIIKEQKTLQPEAALQYVEQVAEGLKYSHKKNILHRDIKPANIMINLEMQAMIADFGLAKVTGAVDDFSSTEAPPPGALNDAHLTQQGAVVGTPYYLSPERIDGINDDPRSDIYALGMVLYHCLTGHPPFIKDTIMEILSAHKTEDPPAIEKFSPYCSKEIIEIYKKSTAKEPKARYQTIEEMLQDIYNIRLAKERKREIAEKKQLSQDMAVALTSMKSETQRKPNAMRSVGPIFAIVFLLGMLAFFMNSDSNENLSKNKIPDVFQTREVDLEWETGKETRIGGYFVQAEKEGDVVIVVVNINVLADTEADEREIHFSHENWKKLLKKLKKDKFSPDEFVAFSGIAEIPEEEDSYLKGDENSFLPVVDLRQYYFQEDKTTLITGGFPSTLGGEYVQVQGTILFISENETDLELFLADNKGLKTWVSITHETLNEVEALKFSPRIGDFVYAIGKLIINEEDENSSHTIIVDESKGDFFTMQRKKQ